MDCEKHTCTYTPAYLLTYLAGTHTGLFCGRLQHDKAGILCILRVQLYFYQHIRACPYCIIYIRTADCRSANRLRKFQAAGGLEFSRSVLLRCMHLFYVHVVRQMSFVGAQRHKSSYKTIRRRRRRRSSQAKPSDKSTAAARRHHTHCLRRRYSILTISPRLAPPPLLSPPSGATTGFHASSLLNLCSKRPCISQRNRWYRSTLQYAELWSRRCFIA